MSKLFIVGNGFDLAHDLPTSFSNFKVFLESECMGQLSYMPATFTDPDGGINPDRATTAGLLINLIDNAVYGPDWEDFEEAMAQYDYFGFFDDCDMNTAIESDNDNDMYHAIYNREDIASDLSMCIPEVKTFFTEWVETIELDTPPQIRFCKLFTSNDLFLTFNYTETLEQIYNIPPAKICHIHGKQGDEIIVGHGEDINPYDEESWETFVIQDTLQYLHNQLKKDVVRCCNVNSDFFDSITQADISDIYSFGFSFSNVDRFYITTICDSVDTKNVVWHLSAYDEEKGENERYKQILRECGFKGRFGELIPNEI